MATLANLPTAPLPVPAGLGYQLPLTGGADSQTYTASSSNPDIQVSPAQGKFLTLSVTHTADPNDPSDVTFTGSMTFQLFGDITPETVGKIEQLVEAGFYTSPTQPTDGSTALNTKNFHRIIAGFAAQAGSITGNGTGKVNAPGYPFPDEFNQQLVFDGNAQLAMANSGDDTNDSQFFITYGPQRSLDFNYTIFGQLVSGLDTLNEMAKVEVQKSASGENSQPVKPVLITSATLSDTDPNGVLHINTTGAQAGETGTVTVTAHDSADGSTTTQTFQVVVSANVDASGNPVKEPAFLNPVQNLTVATGQTVNFGLSATNPQPGSTLTYVVQGGTTTDSSGSTVFSPVQNATASVDSNGIVSLTPNAGFTGVINLLVGVSNSSTSTTSPAGYDTQKMTVTVQNGQVVSMPPVAGNGQKDVAVGSATTVQLPGALGNPSTGGPLSYTIIQGPQHGKLTGFNGATGTFNYTPDINYLGPDPVRFRVTDSGNPNVTSDTGTYTLNVTGAETGAVRVLDRTLIVTPPGVHGSGKNTVDVSVVNGNYVVKVNGIPDVDQPSLPSIDDVIVYGNKASTVITVDPSVTVPAVLSGGRGGVNVINAGSGNSILRGWFGRNTLQGGAGRDLLVGRKGAVRAKYSPGGDLVFLGRGFDGRKDHGNYGHGTKPYVPYPLYYFAKPRPPIGTFYVFGPHKNLVPVDETAKPATGTTGSPSGGHSTAAGRRQALIEARQARLQALRANEAARREALQAQQKKA